MYDTIKLVCFMVGFIGLGMLINHTANMLYWLWLEWRNKNNEDD